MRPAVLLAFAAATAACSSSPGAPDAAVGDDTSVIAFDGEHVYFGDENRRTVDTQVTFPTLDLAYERTTLAFALRCPNNRCDWWDRLGRLSLVEDVGTDNEREIEILRFITPYRLEGSWRVDVSDLRPLLHGDVTLRVFIDTWVGPGHANGDGWLVDASFEMLGGIPDLMPIAVIPLWPPHSVTYGDPAAPIDEQIEIALPEGIRAARVRTLVTGHGQGNAENCAEFIVEWTDGSYVIDTDQSSGVAWYGRPRDVNNDGRVETFTDANGDSYAATNGPSAATTYGIVRRDRTSSEKLQSHREHISHMEEEIKGQGKKLKSSQRLAEVGMLSSGVAHDLKNPLTVIMATVDMMLEHGKLNGHTEE